MILVSSSRFRCTSSICFPYHSFYCSHMQPQENLFQFKTLTLGKHLRIYMCWAVYKSRAGRGNNGSVQDPERSGHHFTASALGNKICGLTWVPWSVCVSGPNALLSAVCPELPATNRSPYAHFTYAKRPMVSLFLYGQYCWNSILWSSGKYFYPISVLLSVLELVLTEHKSQTDFLPF